MSDASEQFVAEIVAALGAWASGELAGAIGHLHEALEVDFEPDLAHILSQAEAALEDERPFDLRAHMTPLCAELGIDLSSTQLVATEEIDGAQSFFEDELILDFEDAFDSVDQALDDDIEIDQGAAITGKMATPSSNDFSDLFELDDEDEADLPAPGGEVASAMIELGESDALDDMVPSESGLHMVRRARYAGVAPPPPSHRRGGSGESGANSFPADSEEPADDDDDWDFGFGVGGPEPSLLDSASQDGPEIGFDPGATEPTTDAGAPHSVEHDTSSQPSHLDIEPEVQRAGNGEGAGVGFGSHLDIEPEVQRAGNGEGAGVGFGSHLDIEPEVQRVGESPAAMSNRDMGQGPKGHASAARPSEPANEAITDRVPQQGVRQRPKQQVRKDVKTRPVDAVPSATTPATRPVDSARLRQSNVDAPDTVRVPMQGRRGASAAPGPSVQRARELAFAGDTQAALDMCKSLLAEDPGHGEARSLLRAYGERIANERRLALEPLHRIPRVNTAMLPSAGSVLNPKSMFILSMIDGASSLQDLIDMSGLPSGEATDILATMVDARLLDF